MTRSTVDLIDILERRLGYRFCEPRWALTALTHRSHSNDHNERLEFLGDGVLGLAIADLLIDRHPEFDEGELSRRRANLVNRDTLGNLAEQMGLPELLRLGSAELKSAGHRRPSILADSLEALLGAVFKDGGWEAARTTIRAVFLEAMATEDQRQDSGKDSKTALQEWLQARHQALPEYQLIRTQGPDHAREFFVSCRFLADQPVSEGRGGSRRAAEQAAAQSALDWIEAGVGS